MKTIGVISDTHKLLRPEAIAALQGVDHIVHAGDIGSEAVLEALRELAPLDAIKGNIDRETWADCLPETLNLEIDGLRIHMAHNLKTVSARQITESNVVIVGHSHKPLIDDSNGALIFNPGSAGPRRFSLPIALGLLHLDPAGPRPEIIELPVPAPAKAQRKRRNRR